MNSLEAHDAKNVFQNFLKSESRLILVTRIAVLFAAFMLIFMVSSWAYYSFWPQSTFFEYHDVVGVEMNPNGSIVVESDRTIKRSGLYIFDSSLDCIVGNYDEPVGWQSVAKQGQQAAAVLGPREIPPIRWTFAASAGVWNQGNVYMPALCRFRSIITLHLPRNAVRSQAIIGSEFLVSDGVIAPNGIPDN